MIYLSSRSICWAFLLLVVLGACMGAGFLLARDSVVPENELRHVQQADNMFEGSSAPADYYGESVLAASSNRISTWAAGYAVDEQNFEHGQNILFAQYGAESPQLSSYILDWSHACMNSSLGESASDGSSRAAVAIMSKFCAGVVPMSDVDAAEMYKKSVRTEFALELSQIEKLQGVDAALSFAERYIRSAKDPYSARAGLDYMARAGVLSPPASHRRTKSEQRMREIYQMARDSYMCNIYGGCSATSAISARFCLETKCSSMTDYQNQVRRQLSQSDTLAFNWYVSAIRALDN